MDLTAQFVIVFCALTLIGVGLGFIMGSLHEADRWMAIRRREDKLWEKRLAEIREAK